MLVPQRDLDSVAGAHRRLLETTRQLTEDDVRRPSLLPGWSRGHVLTHLARNADSHVRRAAAAVRGEMVEQYEDGLEGRQADIEAGSSRPAAEILDDVRHSAGALERAWCELPASAWRARSRDVGGMERHLFELPSRRWQEVEVHLVDLGTGVSQRDWPDDFVLEWLPRTRERMWGQLSPEAASQRFEAPADELCWLYGRLRVEGLPQPPYWG